MTNHSSELTKHFSASWLLFAVLVFAPTARAAEPSFERVATILEKRCVQCHSADETKGGLSLESRARLLQGGDSGPAIDMKRPQASLLLEMIQGDAPEMPKSAPKLTPEEVATIAGWLTAGAPWPADKALADRSLADSNWWSLKPLMRPALPQLTAADKAWSQNPIDAFVIAKLREQGFAPSPVADRRTLLRRLSFDLTGLPPSPAEVEQFVNDRAPQAYERLVDRLLDSPRYGERWARHWLDVVHFGETHGYDKDKPRPHAWPYRDYVIRAFNEDKPYARFVEEQIAGDVLYPGTADGIEALGFIAAGPWDFIGHAEVPETKIDGKIARHLDRDDMVSTTIGTFNSLTVGCAQCHNHKFDPIQQVDYYRLQAVFAALDRADRKYHADPVLHAKYVSLETEQRELTTQLDKHRREQRALGGEALVRLDKQIETARQPAPATHPPEHGYHSQISAAQNVEKWVQVDLGEAHPLARVVLVACYDDFNSIGAGFGFPVRLRVTATNDPDWKTGVTVLADHSLADIANPGTKPFPIAVDGLSARYIRVTATRLAPRQNDYILALAELQAFDKADKNVAAGAKVTALDSIEAPIRWRQSNLVDGLFPSDKNSSAAVLADLSKQREALLAQVTPAELQTALTRTEQQLAQVSRELSQLPPPRVVYAGTVHHGSGTFLGTGSRGGQPRAIHLLHRGDVKSPRAEVTPAALQCLPGWPGEFSLASHHGEGERRAALARWLSDRRNPLTWRSIVNRVWQYHFGRGLVDTPNDFGRMGQLPTHPELLDWLAVEFRDGNQSLKSLHRLMVTSSTYQQQSQPADQVLAQLTRDPRQLDGNNLYLWRMNRRKLEAEAVRDAVLQVSGKLDLKMGGPSFQDFVIDQPAHSPHYEYHLHDPNDPRSHRRSIYRFLVRSQPQPWMAALDCADPSMRVDKRNESLSALQALALLNNGFMVTMSGHFAERVAREAKTPAEQSQLLYRQALAREPSATEQALLSEFIQSHGLPNACRAVLNLNEFTFID
jgi:mono/diheme cytochrome c family protein